MMCYHGDQSLWPARLEIGCLWGLNVISLIFEYMASNVSVLQTTAITKKQRVVVVGGLVHL